MSLVLCIIGDVFECNIEAKLSELMYFLYILLAHAGVKYAYGIVSGVVRIVYDRLKRWDGAFGICVIAGVKDGNDFCVSHLSFLLSAAIVPRLNYIIAAVPSNSQSTPISSSSPVCISAVEL